jgi:hydrogenase small subunit
MNECEATIQSLTRRDFLKASTAVAAALGLKASGVLRVEEALGLESSLGGVPVVWLQALTCTGCSVSLLNSAYFTTIDDLLVNSLDLNYHPNLMAAAGQMAVSAAEDAYSKGGYVLVVEGAIPQAAGGRYCYVWPGMTAQAAVTRYASRAGFILAVGTCASYGGMAAGKPNPTGAAGLDAYYGSTRVIKIPGCPIHPDWVVGTIAYLLANKVAPSLDAYGRPTEYFGRKLHGRWCPYYDGEEIGMLGQVGCAKEIGCKGPETYGDCNQRMWNCGGAGQKGVNWCVGAGSPCIGCTQPNFPDGMSPFYELEGGGGD